MIYRMMDSEQLGRLMYRSNREPRTKLKKYLHRLGGNGSGAELELVLAFARANEQAQAVAGILEQTHLSIIANFKNEESH